MEKKSLKEVLESTSPNVRVIVEKILEVEKGFDYIKNLQAEHNRRIQDKIIKIIKEEVK